MTSITLQSSGKYASARKTNHSTYKNISFHYKTQALGSYVQENLTTTPTGLATSHSLFYLLKLRAPRSRPEYIQRRRNRLFQVFGRLTYKFDQPGVQNPALVQLPAR
jgi:hypothetical protein